MGEINAEVMVADLMAECLPVALENVDRSSLLSTSQAIIAALSPPAHAEASTLPDIGPDPFKGPREEYTLANSEKRLRDAFTVQQKGIPDQTALVWRCDLLKLFHELPRLRSIEEDWRETRAAPPAMPAVESESGERGVERIARLEAALHPFADCCDQISPYESDEDWAKFRLLVKNYREAYDALNAIDGETT